MKKILIVENSSIIIIGIMQLLKDIGFGKNFVDSVNSFDGMLDMTNNNNYKMIFFGLKTNQDKQLHQLLEVVKKHSSTAFLIFSDMMDINIQKEMYKAGINGIIDKVSSKTEIIFAMQRVLDKEMYMNAEYAIKLIFSKIDEKAVSTLTKREMQVAKLLAEGNNNANICYALNLMPSTVSTFKTRIFNKLKIKNVLELKDWKNATLLNKSNTDL